MSEEINTEEVPVEAPAPEAPAQEAAPQAPDGKEFSDTELQAMEQGWSPEGVEGKRNLSAEEFLDRGKLYKELHSLKKQQRRMLETQKEFIEFTERTAKAKAEREYQDKFEALELQRKESIAIGDVEHVADIENQQRRLQDQMRQETAAVQAPQQNEALQNFLDENPWFHSDPEMAAYAQLLDQQAAQQNRPLGNTAAEHYSAIAEKTKAMFKKNKAPNASAVQAPTATMKSKPKSIGIKDLSSEQQAIFKRFSRDLGMKAEDYIKSLKDQGAI